MNLSLLMKEKQANNNNTNISMLQLIIKYF